MVIVCTDFLKASAASPCCSPEKSLTIFFAERANVTGAPWYAAKLIIRDYLKELNREKKVTNKHPKDVVIPKSKPRSVADCLIAKRFWNTVSSIRASF